MTLRIGGFVKAYNSHDVLAPASQNHICRLCGGCDLDWLGYSRMCISDGSGELNFERCDRCSGTGIEPKSLVWLGAWFKPWTWLNFKCDWSS